jgi:predicted site-specific integrase-resolvase
MATLQGSGYVSVGQAANILGVSSSQIRLLCSAGTLTGYILPSGHRRLDRRSVIAYRDGTNLEDEKDYCRGRKIVGYARCSSTGQKESLNRQIQRLSDHMKERYSLEDGSIDIRKEICSSFAGNRKAFFELVDDITQNKISVVISEFKNRFSRVPAQIRLLEYLAEKHNCELVFLDCEEQKSEMEANLLELVDYLQHMSAKAAWAKSSLVTAVRLKEETISLIARLSNEGKCQNDILRILQKDGHTDINGKKISRRVIRRYIKLNGTLKQIVGIDKEKQTNLKTLINEFVAERIHPCEGGEVTMKIMSAKFNEWMVSKGKSPNTQSSIVGKHLIYVLKMPYKVRRGYKIILNINVE